MNFFRKVVCKVQVWHERRQFEALPADIRKDIGWRQAPINCGEV
jgi:hypothetical protein